MIVIGLVLGAVLLSIVGIIASFISQPRMPALDATAIRTAAQLDAAMATQRSARVAQLRQRMADRGYWPYALLGLAFLMQVAAIAVDHLTHPLIAVMSTLSAFLVVFAGRASRRKYLQRQLDCCQG